ncbi:MAG: hypothetical protein ACKO1U_03610 [Bacteroidota bacterium]
MTRLLTNRLLSPKRLLTLVFVAISFTSCRQPVDEKTLIEIASLDTAWTQLGLRLDSLNPTLHVSDTLPMMASERLTEVAFLRFKQAYDSVTIALKEVRDGIASGKIGQEDAAKYLSGFQNNLADATERLDYLGVE